MDDLVALSVHMEPTLTPFRLLNVLRVQPGKTLLPKEAPVLPIVPAVRNRTNVVIYQLNVEILYKNLKTKLYRVL